MALQGLFHIRLLALSIVVTCSLGLTGASGVGANGVDAPTGTPGGILIAASDSDIASKNQADFLCDGVDDQLEIQMAVDSLSDTGGEVRMSKGTFVVFNTQVSPVELYDNLSIQGEGQETRIQLADGVNADCSVFRAVGRHGISIRGMELDGNDSNQNSGAMYGIYFDDVKDSVIEVWSDDFTIANFNLIDSEDVQYQNLYWPLTEDKPVDCQNFDSVVDQFPCSLTVFEEFESGWSKAGDGSGSFEYDSQILHQGDASLRVIKPAGVNSVAVQKGVSLDLAGQHPYVWLRLDEGVTHLYYTLLAPDWNNYYSCNLTLRNDASLQDTWYRMPICITSAAHVENAPDLSNVTRIVVELCGATDPSLSAWVDDMASYPAPKEGKVTFRFDDGWDSVYDVAFPIMNTHGFAGVSGLVTDTIGKADDRMSLDELHEMQDAGWDIVSHSKTHNVRHDSPPGFVDDELRESKSFLVQNGFEKGSRFYVAPGGNVSNTIMEKAKKYYCMASFSWPHMNNAYPYPYVVGAYPVLNETSPNTVEELIDEAKEYGLWLVLMFHKIEESDDKYAYSTAKFEEIVDYVDSVDIPVVTFSDVLDGEYLSSGIVKSGCASPNGAGFDEGELYALSQLLYRFRNIFSAALIGHDYVVACRSSKIRSQ